MQKKKHKKNIIKILMLILILLSSYIFIKGSTYSFNKLNGKSLYFYSIDDDNVIFSKKENKKIGAASLTKVMTALVAYDNIYDLGEYITIDNRGLDFYYENNYAMAGFSQGDYLKKIDLFYGSLLPSGADATYNLVRSTGLSENEFIYLMNEKSKLIGMKNTNFDNIIGIDSKYNYTSAKDMKLLLSYINENNSFIKSVLSSESYYVESIDNYIYHTILSEPNNKTIGIIGGKSGSNIKSGLNWANYLIIDGREYIAITLGSNYYLNTKLKTTPQLDDIKYLLNKI